MGTTGGFAHHPNDCEPFLSVTSCGTNKMTWRKIRGRETHMVDDQVDPAHEEDDDDDAEEDYADGGGHHEPCNKKTPCQIYTMMLK
jgi:hypothetical protein